MLLKNKLFFNSIILQYHKMDQRFYSECRRQSNRISTVNTIESWNFYCRANFWYPVLHRFASFGVQGIRKLQNQSFACLIYQPVYEIVYQLQVYSNIHAFKSHLNFSLKILFIPAINVELMLEISATIKSDILAILPKNVYSHYIVILTYYISPKFSLEKKEIKSL